jgi:hypothetical protein
MSDNMDDLDYLMDAAKSEAGFKKADLSDLAMLIDARDKFAKEALELEEELKKKQAQFRYFDEQEIPNFLRSAGMTSITLADGRKVSYKDEISATLNKEFERDFFRFLEQRGDTDIIKLSYDFPRMEPSKQKELEAAVKQVISDFEKKESVHSATLKKYIKDLLGSGKSSEEITEGLENGTMVREDDVSGFINLYRYAKTTIK